MRALSLTIFLLCLYATIQAQKTFPGFYVTYTHDTIKGNFTDFRQWKNNPSRVQFETAANQQVELTPEICRSFTIAGYDTYETLETDRMTNLTKFSEYRYSEILNGESDTVTYERIKAFFRRIFFNGSVSLYEFSDAKRVNYFIKTVDGLSELIFRVYYVRYKIIEDKTYKAQLATLYARNIEVSKKLKSKIDKLHYEEEAIVSFLENVYKIELVKHKKDRRPTELFIAGGVSYNSFKVKSPDQLVVPPATVNYNSQVVPVIIVGAIHYIQRNFNKYFITTEIRYTSFNHAGKTSTDREWRYKSQIIAPGFGIGAKWVNKESFSWYTTINTSAMIMRGNKEFGYNGLVTERNGRSFIINIGLQTGVLFRNFGIWGQFNPRIVTYSANNYGPTLNFTYAGISWRMPLKK